MKIKSRMDATALIISFTRILWYGSREQLNELIDLIREKQASGTSQVIVELNQVSQINSAGMSVLLELRKMLLNERVPLKLVAPQEKFADYFQMVGAEGLFDIYKATDEALAGHDLTC